MTKTCSNPECLQSNPQTTTDFHRDGRKPDGLRSRCKACELARAASYRSQHQNLLTAKQADYYKRCGDVQRQASRQWKANNQENVQVAWQAWYEANKERRSEYGHNYAAANPAIMIEKVHRRRAMKLAAEGSFTEAEFQAKFIRLGSRCFYCGQHLTNDTVTRDHSIPLTRGGSDSIENIVPACLSCNCRKRTKLPEEFVNAKVGNPEPSRRGDSDLRTVQRLDGEPNNNPSTSARRPEFGAMI